MNGDPIKILLVEDNPGDARLLQEALAETGNGEFELEHVERLRDALETLGEGNFDIALLDLSLPDSQGFDTFERLNDHAPGLPIVILTGLDDEAFGVKAVREGAQDYLVKGQVDSHLLIRSVRYAIERKRAEEALQEAERLRVLAETAIAAAHEIYQPLTALMGFAQILLNTTPDAETQEDMVKKIYKAGQTIDEIVKKMKTVRRFVAKPYVI